MRFIPFADEFSALLAKLISQQSCILWERMLLKSLPPSRKIICCGYILSIIVLLFPVSDGIALTLGEIEVASHLNEPLQAKIFIEEAGNVKASDLTASLAGRESYQRAALEPPLWLDKVSLKITTDMKGKPLIEIATSDPIVDLFAHLLIQVKWSENQLTKHFTLLLDPRAPDKITVIEAKVEKSTSKENRELEKKILNKLGDLEKQINTLNKVNQDISKKYEALKGQHEKLLVQINKAASKEIQSQTPPLAMVEPIQKPNSPDFSKQLRHVTPNAVLALIQNNYLHLSLDLLTSQI